MVQMTFNKAIQDIVRDEKQTWLEYGLWDIVIGLKSCDIDN